MGVLDIANGIIKKALYEVPKIYFVKLSLSKLIRLTKILKYFNRLKMTFIVPSKKQFIGLCLV